MSNDALPERKGRWLGPILFWGLGALLLGASLVIDLRQVARGGSIDLLSHVSGARLLLAGRDPYTYRWQAGDDPRWSDPSTRQGEPYNRQTATPGLLVVQLPLTWLPYRTAQFVWLAVEWGSWLALGFLAWRAGPAGRWPGWGGVAFVAVTFTGAWRFHLERGQSYLLFPLLFCLWWRLAGAEREKGRSWGQALGGFVLGVLATLRPPFFLAFPWVLLRQPGQVPGLIAGTAVGVLLPVLAQPAVWSDYARAMTLRAADTLVGHGHEAGLAVAPFASDGQTVDFLRRASPLPFGDFSVLHFWRDYLGAPAPFYFAQGAFLVAFLCWLGGTRRAGLPQARLGLVGWCCLAELLLPAPRLSYNDVVFLGALLGCGAIERARPGGGLEWIFVGLAIGVGLVVALVPPGGLPPGLPNCSTLLLVFAAGGRVLASGRRGAEGARR